MKNVNVFNGVPDYHGVLAPFFQLLLTDQNQSANIDD